MNWQFENDRPIWLQLFEIMTVQLASGVYAPGARLPSVRELAATAGVNPNTMQRALSEMEKEGLLVTNRTAGRTVTDDSSKLNAIRSELAEKRALTFLKDMHALGYTDDESIAIVTNNRGESV